MLWKMSRILILLLALAGTAAITNSEDQNQRGIVHVYGSSRIKVKLECGAKFMNVNLYINGTAPFFDWIVVGKTNRPECRQQGNGDLQYLIEIPLINDPCGTRIIGVSSTFENVISIKRMPLLILEGDETISIQCVYGPPEIGTAVIPTLPPSQQNVQQSFLTTPKREQSIDDSSNTVETTKVAGILPAHIYLIIFMVLFLTLLCLCCGCMFFFFKRRKLRVERRKKLLLAVPANSEMSKLGLRHLWWSGKHGLTGTNSPNGGTVSNDALLSHDYMISTNSTGHGHLSVSTDYPGTTPPSSGGSSNVSAGTANGLIIHSGQPGHDSPNSGSGGSGNMQMYVHDDRRMMSRAHMEQHSMAAVASRTAAGVIVTANVVANSLRCIPEERLEHGSMSRGHMQKSQSQQNISRRPVYASVDKKKLYQSDSPNSSHTTPSGNESPPITIQGDTLISHVRSVSEIYSVPSHNGLEETDPDAVSVSTLEGKQYSPTQEQIRQATIVRADVHHHSMSPPPVPPPPPLVSSPPLTSPPPPPTDDLPLFAPPPKAGQIPAQIDWQVYIRAVENDRSQIFTDRDVDRWRRLMTDDQDIRRQILNAKTMEDFEAISHSGKYSREFTEEKWAVIVQNLSQVAFMRRLNKIIDTQHGAQQSQHKSTAPKANQVPLPVKPLDPSQLNSNYDMGETLRNLQNGRQKRLFTRESYYQVKQGVAPVAVLNGSDMNGDKSPVNKPYIVGKDGTVTNGYAEPNQASTTATMLSQPFRDRSSSEIFEMPPMLTVYLGDVPSERNMYGDNFLNGTENGYSTTSNMGASMATVSKPSYHYESTATKTDDEEHQYNHIGGMASSQSIIGSNGAIGEVYAAPSTSTIYGPTTPANGQWKHF